MTAGDTVVNTQNRCRHAPGKIRRVSCGSARKRRCAFMNDPRRHATCMTTRVRLVLRRQPPSTLGRHTVTATASRTESLSATSLTHRSIHGQPCVFVQALRTTGIDHGGLPTTCHDLRPTGILCRGTFNGCRSGQSPPQRRCHRATSACWRGVSTR